MSWQSKMLDRIQRENNTINANDMSRSGETRDASGIILFDSDDVDVYEVIDDENEFGFKAEETYKMIKHNLKCDMHSISLEKAKELWGYDIKPTEKMICRYNDFITESCLIKWFGKFYQIEKLQKCKNISFSDNDAFLRIYLKMRENQDINIIEDIPGGDTP